MTTFFRGASLTHSLTHSQYLRIKCNPKLLQSWHWFGLCFRVGAQWPKGLLLSKLNQFNFASSFGKTKISKQRHLLHDFKVDLIRVTNIKPRIQDTEYKTAWTLSKMNKYWHSHSLWKISIFIDIHLNKWLFTNTFWWCILSVVNIHPSKYFW